MRPSRSPRLALLSSTIAVLLAGAAPAHARLHVVATTADLGAIAHDIGGTDIDVDVLAAPTEDPHFVDPKPNLIIKLNQADLLVQNGLELEVGWLPKLVVQARNARLAPGAPGMLDASRVVTLLDVPQGKVDRAMGDVHPGGNPHFTLDPRRGAQVARALGERMAQLDPSIAAAVRARADAEVRALDALAKQTRARVDALPADKHRVVAYHRSLSYLNDWLGLQEVADVEPRPGIPPDPGHIAVVLQTMKSAGARCVLQEEYYPKNTSQTLAQLGGAKLVVIAGGAHVAQGEGYVARVQKLADTILAALGA